MRVRVQMKGWLLYLVIGGLAVFTVGITNPVLPVDAPLLEILAATPGSDWARGFDASALRWFAGAEPTTTESAMERLAFVAWVRALLPGVRNLCLLLILGVLAFGIGRWKKSFAPVAPFVAFGLLLVWLAASAFQRSAWSVPGRQPASLLEMPNQLLRAYERAVASTTAAAPGSSVWLSPAALRWLPQLGIPTDIGQLSAAAAQSVNPALWRSAQQEPGHQGRLKYGAVLFAGAVSEVRPLMDFLLQDPFWTPIFIEPGALVFGLREGVARSGSEGAVPTAAEISRRFPDTTERARYLAQLATMLLELGRNGDARRMFRSAMELGGSQPDVRCLYASFLARRGQWAEAIYEARAVLESHPRYVPALQVLVQAELAAERPENAWSAAKELLRLQPRDPQVLFLHARAANAAGASYAEAGSLRKLIRLAQSMGVSVSGYRIFLGQALARQALIDQARAEFRAALDAGDLTPEQIESVNEFLERLDAAR